MAVLTFPGAPAVLSAQAAALPQPDQLCGPFAAAAAVCAVLLEGPSLLELALAADTRIWPHDVAGWRPPGAPLDRRHWDELPRADRPAASGTNAAALALAVAATTHGEVAVVPVDGRAATLPQLASLLASLTESPSAVGVIANVDTGALDPEAGWTVGHFVVLWAFDAQRQEVAVADSYAERGADGCPPGCCWVSLAALTSAISAPPGRGLLILTTAGDADRLGAIIERCGLARTLWSS